MSVLDMVQYVGGLDRQEAAECVAHYFHVPRIAMGSRFKNPDCFPEPPACKDPIRLLVSSGIWASLSVCAQRLIPVFLALAEWEEFVECSKHMPYRTMTRYSGIKSPNAIKSALDELEKIGFLRRLESRTRGASPIKEAGEFVVTPLSEKLKQLADGTAPKFGAEIKSEKAARKQQRQERQRVARVILRGRSRK
jgi:hypothetical protein